MYMPSDLEKTLGVTGLGEQVVHRASHFFASGPGGEQTMLIFFNVSSTFTYSLGLHFYYFGRKIARAM